MEILQGYVAIIGKPNVGKSTLTNTILKQKLAITSYKPQTTRNKIMGIYNDENTHIIFIDTPGFHKAKNKLDLFLNSEVKKGLKLADVVLFLIDPTRAIDDEDLEIMHQLNVWKVKNLIPVITKKDIVNKKDLVECQKFIEKNFENIKFLEISCLSQTSIKSLIENIKNFLEPHEEIIYPNSTQIELSDNFVINEIVRETIIELCKHELPYSTAVFTNSVKYDPEKKLLKIQADIIVEKESQKPIVIGKSGQMIKKIGEISRKKLLDFFDSRIYLELFVKVKKNWRDDNNDIINLGYKK